MSNIYEELSAERKKLQDEGKLPDWVTTLSWQMLKEKYLHPEWPELLSTYRRISSHAAKYTDDPKHWEEKFFDVMWKGWLSLSTPVLANMGTGKNCPVSCSGGIIGDSVFDFYDMQVETALLSKNGFGTSAYLGDIRPRGAKISGLKGGASGVLPVFKDYVQLSKDISQGNSRKGAWAGYIEIDHPDFYELVQYIKKFPDDCNIGWNITNNFIERLDNGDLDALDRYQEAMLLKMLTGKGYFLFIDRVNEQNPLMYKDKGYTVKASNLCNEIMLSAKEDETYTCILSSMNLSKFDEWKNTDAVFVSTVFLDCVNSDFIEIAKNIKGLERAVKFAERHRALGLGVLGFATYLQDHMMSFSGMEAHYMNIEMFAHLDDESLRASKWMAQQWGEPEMCKGYGVRNTHRLTCPPTMSTSIIVGSISQGIEPFFENAYTQGSAAGDMQRINPSLLPIMKERNVYNKKTITDIINNNGSVQHVTWLNEYEKEVFRTAFEIPQDAILRLASTRQRRIDQGQSVNLYFGADEEEEYISKIHKMAFKDDRIKGLYYVRSKSGVKASKEACENCQG
jgi:ribonucleoside-diphosphate reductase alpha chain